MHDQIAGNGLDVRGTPVINIQHLVFDLEPPSLVKFVELGHVCGVSSSETVD